MPASRREQGMTLIEVLVALLVVALALAAAIRSVDAGVVNIDYLKQRTLAQWVAMNHATELQLGLEKAKGSKRHEVEMAGQTWQVQSTASATSDNAILRVDVVVRKDPQAESSLANIVTYVGKP